MRTRISRLMMLLALGLSLAPEQTWGQDVPPPPLGFLPLGRERYEEGGMVMAGGVLWMRQTNPLGRQDIAFRGFFDATGDISGTPGTFIGSKSVALNSRDVSGPVSRQPGLEVVVGWRFADQSAIMVDVWHMSETRTSATATFIPPGFAIGLDGAEGFLSAPVSNFPPEFAGPLGDVNGGGPETGYGVWNAAGLMQIEFLQRFDMVNINYRTPIDTGDDSFHYFGICGFRSIIMFERFKWRTVNYAPISDPFLDSAIYSNTVSNRLYGATLGCEGDWFWGDTPIGGFSGRLACTSSLCIDLVKERARYERGDRGGPVATRAINEFTLAPVVQLEASVDWRPTMGVEVRLGWDFLASFNTVASEHPVDFNYGRLTPGWERGQLRLMRGFTFAVALTF